jgi:phosphatidate cytidylyltransferase
MPPIATVWLLTVLVLLGAWEWAGFISAGSVMARLGFTILVGACLLAGWFFVLESPWLQQVMLVAVVWWLLAFLWIMVAPERVPRVSAALAGLLVLVPCWLALVFFATHTRPHYAWVLFTLALVWAADTGAYFAGRLLGKVPLAPRVSPKKTWEGVIGGLLVSAIVAYFGGVWLGVPGVGFISLCVGVAAISVVGDLTESMLKRAAGLKDSGSLFPGHGGVLDRIDSVTAAAPTLLFGLYGLGFLQ